jgi:hypothetical protein
MSLQVFADAPVGRPVDLHVLNAHAPEMGDAVAAVYLKPSAKVEGQPDERRRQQPEETGRVEI